MTTRLEIVEAALAKDRAALEDGRRRFVELAEKEDAAVKESKAAEPGRSAYTVGSPAQTARAEREKLERTLDGLEKQVLALQAERDGAAAEEAARELDEASKEAERFRRQERQARRAFGEAFAALVEQADELLAVLSARDVLVGEVKAASLRERVGIFDRPALERFEHATVPLVDPRPRTFHDLIDEALAASTGPRAADDEDGLIELNRQRREQGLAAEVRIVSPSRQELEAAYPDLRKKIAAAEATPKSVPAGLREFGFGVDLPGSAA